MINRLLSAVLELAAWVVTIAGFVAVVLVVVACDALAIGTPVVLALALLCLLLKLLL